MKARDVVGLRMYTWGVMDVLLGQIVSFVNKC
jgi:hypothetical protein